MKVKYLGKKRKRRKSIQIKFGKIIKIQSIHKVKIKLYKIKIYLKGGLAK